MKYNFVSKVYKQGNSYVIVIPANVRKMMVGELGEGIGGKLLKVEVAL